MRVYEKLVRDRIPDIVRADGRVPVTHVAGDAEYLVALKAKVVEEAQELAATTDTVSVVEEAADVLEVLRATTTALGVPWATVERKAEEKAADRGAFAGRIILDRVE
jgi:predicted house-cleaning noncanonical NTP pyrophosphatase (MazG superfamily)